MTENEVKRRLGAFREAVGQLNTARRNLEELETIAAGAGGIDYAKERVTSSPVTTDRIGERVDELAALREIFAARKAEALEAMKDAAELISLVTTAKGYDLLSRRYIYGETWDEIGFGMRYSFRQLIRIHAQAIEEIRKELERMAHNVT